MTRFPRRILLLLLPLLAAAGQVLPGRAQTGGSSRYAFADTLLLRDTLGLKFDGLFPTADSLQLSPDTLRAHMIRYRFSLQRLLALADSMAVPVDSVGTTIDRERFNPLARRGGAAVRRQNDFRYTSGWTTTKQTSSWSNNSEYRLLRGAWYANNRTDITLERYKSVTSTTLRQTRDMTTEAGARFSDKSTIGVTTHTLLYDSYDPASTSNSQETLNEVKLTARTQARGRRGNSTDLTVFGGYLNDAKDAELKRGLTGRADGRVRTVLGQWLSNDLSGGTSANVARTRKDEARAELRAFDLATNVNGTLTMWATKPVGFNLNYGLRRTRVDTPTDTGVVNTIRQAGDNVAGTLRVRLDNEHTFNAIGNTTSNLTSTGRRRDASGKASLRWVLLGWATDANYDDRRGRANYPRKNGTYGYIERSTTRSADAQFQRALGRRLQAKLAAAINLTRSRYEATSLSATPPSPRDTYRQSYRAETRYNPTQRLNSSTALEVVLSRTINIERLTTSSNTDTRTYRGEWTWSYQMFQGLTVAQNNRISADYQFYPFANSRNTLGLSYNTITTLNTVLTPRLSVSVVHTALQSPRGSYTLQDDGLEALKLSDEARNLGLHASIRYAPTPAVSFTLEPDYRADARSGTTNGVSAKQRDDRKLDMAGRVDLNVPIGRRGTLTGGIARNYTDARSTSYTNSVPTVSPRSITDYWNGSLTLTWTL